MQVFTAVSSCPNGRRSRGVWRGDREQGLFQGRMAADAVPGVVVFRQLSRPGECRLRGADDECRSRLRRPRPIGFGAGIFFIAYAALEVPSNVILERVGARLWIFRIMLTWGVLSAATAFVYDETSFYRLRFLLGAAEAGFFPGMIFYLSRWFPAPHARAHDCRLHGRGAACRHHRRAALRRHSRAARVLPDWPAGNGCS